MVKRFSLALLSVGLLLSIGSGAVLAQGTPVPQANVEKVEQNALLANGTLYVTWNKISNADYYEVSYRNLATNIATTHTITGANNTSFNWSLQPAHYRVWVGAYKSNGQLILQSDAVEGVFITSGQLKFVPLTIYKP
ncbi:hypothetical protein MH117_00225 [Paenibacillus sp. ACRRX]|uniref:hypothetical protein n=1 Tax=Paenibacillus sp. ACRRX TaxID=2918206 RepID=UPI001EF3FE1F|nr:hypothetical protein [Paenibacillus sp. ACRRX]MCG7405830.1 hypothetical protein [Paenibacillus sp. ACRRX]